MGKLRNFAEGLDHPLVFVIFLGMALYGLTNVVKWGSDKWNIPGLKSTLPQ